MCSKITFFSSKIFICILNFSDESQKYNTLIENIQAGNTHRTIAERQSQSYKNCKENLAKDTLLIELDWKQKVIIGNTKYFLELS